MSKATHGHQGGNAWGPCQEPGCGELLAHPNHEVQPLVRSGVVERLVRVITTARRRGDEAARAIAYARLMGMASQPGFHRALDLALDTVDWRA